jgi:acyl-CoA thioester hydrolase
LLALYEPGNEAAWLASFRFSVEVRPRYCECDGQGHVSNVVYPEYLELSRLQFFMTAGDPEPGDFAFQHVTAELRLRYVSACFYDEPIAIYSKLVSLGRSSAVMDQAMAGADGTIRAISRVAIVRSQSAGAAPWSQAQRAALERFCGGPLPNAPPQS